MKINQQLFLTRCQELNLSEAELIQDICSFEDLQKLKSGQTVELRILHKLSKKLQISWLQLIDGASFTKTKPLLAIVDYLYNRNCYEEGFCLLRTHLKPKKLDDTQTLARTWYYYGLGYLFSENDLNQALWHFQRSFTMAQGEGPYSLLAMDGQAVAYWQNDEHKRTKTYYKKILDLLKLYEDPRPAELALIFNNAAGFFSHLEDHKKAYDLCRQGIALIQLNQTSELLEHLLFNQAINQLLGAIQAEQSPEEVLQQAYHYAIYNENHDLLNKINQTLISFGMLEKETGA